MKSKIKIKIDKQNNFGTEYQPPASTIKTKSKTDAPLNQHSKQKSNEVELENLEEALKVIKKLEYEEWEREQTYDYKLEEQSMNEVLNLFEEERRKINHKMRNMKKNRYLSNIRTYSAQDDIKNQHKYDEKKKN
eukprot:294391_1